MLRWNKALQLVKSSHVISWPIKALLLCFQICCWHRLKGTCRCLKVKDFFDCRCQVHQRSTDHNVSYFIPNNFTLSSLSLIEIIQSKFYDFPVIKNDSRTINSNCHFYGKTDRLLLTRFSAEFCKSNRTQSSSSSSEWRFDLHWQS